MSILRLPVETVCRIFSLSVQGRHLPFMVTSPELEDFFSTRDCIYPDDIVSVCRRWREIALSDPALWSTLFLSLRCSTNKSLRRSIKAVDHCLERSRNMPLSCFITSTFEPLQRSHDRLVLRLLCALFEHQKRWRAVKIHLPNDFLGRMAKNVVHPYFMLRTEKLGMLEGLSMDWPSKMVFRVCGIHQLSSLTSLELTLDYDSSDATQWLFHTPNLERLSMSWHILNVDFWDPTRTPIRLERLRYLKLLSPPLALQCLDCPALEDMTIIGDYYSNSVTQFHSFLSRSPSLHTLRIQKALPWRDPDQSMREYLVPSSLKYLSLYTFGLCESATSLATCKLFEILSEKQSTSAFNAGSSAFGTLPELEALKLIGFVFSIESFVELIATRWNAKERRLKLVKLVRCFVKLSSESSYSICSDPATSSAVRLAAKSLLDEGLQLQISEHKLQHNGLRGNLMLRHY